MPRHSLDHCMFEDVLLPLRYQVRVSSGFGKRTYLVGEEYVLPNHLTIKVLGMNDTEFECRAAHTCGSTTSIVLPRAAGVETKAKVTGVLPSPVRPSTAAAFGDARLLAS